MRTNKKIYHEYLQTAAWQAVRARKLAAVGHCCEFRTPVDHKHDVRCTVTTDLHVHHLTYERLGQELDRDLQVLCPQHHLVTHVLSQECEWCGDDVYFHVEDAEIVVETARAEIGEFAGVSQALWNAVEYHTSSICVLTATTCCPTNPLNKSIPAKPTKRRAKHD